MAGNASAPDTRTPEEVGASAMKKAIWRLGPFLGLLYLVAYMDRNNAGFAKLETTGSAIWGLLLIAGLTLLGATIAFGLSRRADFTVPAEALLAADAKSGVR